MAWTREAFSTARPPASVSSARVVNNTGTPTPLELSALPEQSSSSVYLAIGESLPSPPPESISEVRVNTSMYDAQQGSTSGAHIDMSTASGTNNIHGSVYVHRGTNWLNADPFFYNADPNIPASEKNPQLHRYTAGGTMGLPIKKDKLFLLCQLSAHARFGRGNRHLPARSSAWTGSRAIDAGWDYLHCRERLPPKPRCNCLAAIANATPPP